MKLLAVETATEACSAALYLDGQLTEQYQFAPRRHAELLLAMADTLLSEAGLVPAQLDALAFGRGPGAFTGVRIATGVVQGIAYAADLPVVPVSTLATLAQGGYREFGWQRVAAAIDARMNEVYWGTFQADDNGVMQPLAEERVCPASQVPALQGEAWHGIGSGWGTFAEELKEAAGSGLVDGQGGYLPHARDAALIAADAYRRGLAVSAEQALPVYLRDQVVAQPAGKG
jgi:tRNA threonylcarbamoyladenosine biosynthesis protein TsaB